MLELVVERQPDDVRSGLTKESVICKAPVSWANAHVFAWMTTQVFSKPLKSTYDSRDLTGRIRVRLCRNPKFVASFCAIVHVTMTPVFSRPYYQNFIFDGFDQGGASRVDLRRGELYIVCTVTVSSSHFSSPRKFWTRTCSPIVNFRFFLPSFIILIDRYR